MRVPRDLLPSRRQSYRLDLLAVVCIGCAALAVALVVVVGRG